MAKKDGIEIFELFRNGGQKTSVTEAPVESPTKTVTRPLPPPVASRPAPQPSAIATAPESAHGDALISMKLNTALFGLMVGAACLFGSFALGVQYERRQANKASAPEVAATPPVKEVVAEKPTVLRPPPPAQPRAEDRTAVTPPQPPAPAQPKKGWTLQLMAYPEADLNLAQRLCSRVKQQGGSEASVVKIGGNHVVLAGFVEKQTGTDSEALLAKYKRIAGDLNLRLDLSWLSQTR